MPKVSVILPYYNAGDTLQSAAKSILDQTFKDLELILVNNSSTDSGPRIAENLAKKDNRIILANEPKQGIVPALLKGYKNSNGKYIVRMDADDISTSKRIDLQNHFLDKNPDYGLVSGKVNLFPVTVSNKGLQRYVNWHNELLEHEQIRKKSFIDSPVIHPSIMFRRSMAEKYGYLASGDFPEDYELFMRWLKAGVKFHKMNQIILYWQDSGTKLTRIDKRYRQEAFFRIKVKYLSDFLKKYNPHHPKIYLWGDGKNAKKLRELLIDSELEIQASFEVDPKKIDNKNVFHYSEIPENGIIFILSLVSNRGAGEHIKKYLQSFGYQEGKNLILFG